MFQLALFKFCESYKAFTLQNLARFIFEHRDCERMAKSAGVTPRQYASLFSREFIGKMLSCGYLDMKDGVMKSNGSLKRPSSIIREIDNWQQSERIHLIMNVGKMSDEELFPE